MATLAVVVASARTHRSLLGGVTAAIVLVSTYSLATRLFPERLGRFDAIAGYRLSVPVGYWNALGIFAAMGVLLAFGFAVRGLQPIARAVAGASTVPLTATLYFTYSRGAWVALAFGALAMLALDTRRLQLLGAFLLIAPPAAVGVWLASRFEALTNRGSTLAAASPDGHRLALLLAFLSICAIAATVVLSSLAKRLKPQRTARMVLGIAIIGAVVGLLLGIFARYGSPSTLARRAYDSFSAPAPAIPTNLNKRLFVLSGGQRVPQWKVAWHDVKAHPWLGSGAGSYHAYWLQRRPIAAPVLDAHSLYLETLAEMGPVGLALVVGALLMPIIAAVRTRHRSLVAPAFGTYCAYLLHAGVDWDWEMLAVTAVAVLVGAALLGVARPDDARPLSITARGALVIACAGASAFAFVGLLPNVGEPLRQTRERPSGGLPGPPPAGSSSARYSSSRVSSKMPARAFEKGSRSHPITGSSGSTSRSPAPARLGIRQPCRRCASIRSPPRSRKYAQGLVSEPEGRTRGLWPRIPSRIQNRSWSGRTRTSRTGSALVPRRRTSRARCSSKRCGTATRTTRLVVSRSRG
ncbi:MAG: hypothetical protein E6G14_16150 [Actinobacteria bacterium]|nr:MAG: hypothetical protein E6G14_16150 [Actinomycetota bacterium]